MAGNKGVDRGTPFTEKEVTILKKHGYVFVCRYLSKSAWKRLTKNEATIISKAGLYNVVVYQDSNNGVQHFTYAKGLEQGIEAVKQAKGLGMPSGKPIFFAVDFDAIKQSDFNAIEDYFLGVEKSLYGSGYEIGVYGSYSVVNHVVERNKNVTFKWQTYAWSKGKVCDYNLYQHKNGIDLPEDSSVKNIDLNMSNGAGGGWRL